MLDSFYNTETILFLREDRRLSKKVVRDKGKNAHVGYFSSPIREPWSTNAQGLERLKQASLTITQSQVCSLNLHGLEKNIIRLSTGEGELGPTSCFDPYRAI